jgi:peptidyl-prolyl cis-trans isomerase SurA
MTKFVSLSVACVVSAVLLATGIAQAQGLRPSTSLSGVRAGAAPGAQRSADFIVAIVNSEPITNNEVRARVLRFEQQQTQRGGTLPARAELMEQMLQRLISERAQVQVGRENGVKVDDAAVNASVLAIARQNQVSLDELRKRIEADGISYAQFRESIREDMLLTRVREREVEGRVSITEQELDVFIVEQQGSIEVNSLELNIAQILIAVPESATESEIAALQARANAAAERVRAGEDFGVLARSQSQSLDRASGGVMGLRSADRYPSLFVDAVRAAKVGSITGPLRSGAGFHILKLLDKKQTAAPGMTVQQSRARHILLRLSAQRSESAAKERLAALRSEIAGGKLDFAVAAKDNSQDGSAAEGGDLGWVYPGQFVPEFEDVMNTLAPGQMSQPVVSRFGVHLIQLMERRETSLSVRQQRELARANLREKKAEEAFVTWAEDVRARAYVELREPVQ